MKQAEVLLDDARSLLVDVVDDRPLDANLRDYNNIELCADLHQQRTPVYPSSTGRQHMSTVYVDIVPARQWFSRRKQWKYQLSGANYEPLDPRDTYANVGDIFAMLMTVRTAEMHVRVHYATGVETTVLRAVQP